MVKMDLLFWNLRVPPTWLAVYTALYNDCRDLKKTKTIPRNFISVHARDILRELCVFPDELALQKPLYKVYMSCGFATIFLFWITVMRNLFATANDVAAFGESMMFLLGISVILFKTIFYVRNWKAATCIIADFNTLHQRNSRIKNERIRDIQSTFFIAELGSLLFSHFLALTLFITLSLQPMFTEQSTPLECIFPFDLQDPQKHPWGAKLVYAFQIFAIFYGLYTLVINDCMAGCSIIATAENLRILSERLRALGAGVTEHSGKENFEADLRELVEYHQYIISLTDRINATYHYTYLIQMFSSSLMLGIAGFEALLSSDNTIVLLKFIIFMNAAVLQLIYWCVIGNVVYYDSQDVAIAAFEVNEWFTQAPALQRNLILLTQRAQKPLQFRPKPLWSFNMQTFTQIIRVSYTAFTVLYGFVKASEDSHSIQL